MKSDSGQAAQQSRVERLFTAECELRDAAISYSGWERASIEPSQLGNRNASRKRLRLAAVAYAELAIAIDEESP